MLKGTLRIQRHCWDPGTLQTPDSPESAALFKAREDMQESQPRDDGGLAALPKPRMLHHLLRRRGLAAPLIHPFSTPLPLPPTPGKPSRDETPGEGPRDSQEAPLLPEPHSRAFAPARSGWAAPARLHLNLARVRTTGHRHCLPWGEAGSPLPRLFGSCRWTCGLTVPAPSAARDPRPARGERWCGPPPQASLLRGGQAAGRTRRERAGTATGERPRPGTGGSRGRARSSPGRGRRSRGARAAPG